ncbi:MAG: hypothetical protein V7740_17420, partial [Pseudomonas marincola]
MVTLNNNNGSETNSGVNGNVKSVSPGEVIQLTASSLDELAFTQQGGSLIVTPLGGGEPTIYEDFFVVSGTELPPQLTLDGGTVLTSDELIALIEDFDATNIAPAAGGGAGGDGGGASFSAYSDDGIGDGISIEDLLPPTELEFTAQEEEEFLNA